MALDKIVDSAKLDGALTATADAIRGKTGDATPIAWDAGKGFADAIAAIAAGGGGGTLAVNSGTFTTTQSYTTITVQHGCGKLPVAVFIYIQNPIDTEPTLNTLGGGYWHRESFSALFRSSTTGLLDGGAIKQYVVGKDETNNTLIVNDTIITVNPPLQWRYGTYDWIAIYEV